MAAPHRLGDDTPHGGRRRNWLLGLTPPVPGTPKGVPDVSTLTDEIAELRGRLAAAEKRAREAESALPHLLGLGQNTVNGLLDDARARGRQIIEAARAQAAQELAAERAAVREESRDLESLRMAVAAEAMGLEQIRAELQRRISLSAAEMARVANHPQLLGQSLPLAEHGIGPVAVAAIASPGAVSLDPPPELRDVIDPDPASAIGVIEASTTPADAVEAQLAVAQAVETTAVEVGAVDAPAAAPSVVAEREDVPRVVVLEDDDSRPSSNPSPGFAAAWAEAEDDDVAEAFDRFFSADVDNEPSRDWILADDTKP